MDESAGQSGLCATLCARGVRASAGVVVPTWYGVGGCAAVLAEPTDEAGLAACLSGCSLPGRSSSDGGAGVLVLGEGANLLVLDSGVDRLVVRLSGAWWRSFGRIDSHDAAAAADGGRVFVRAGGGADLMKLVAWSVREGLGGLEGLGGIPASVGGAAVMNAGGAFGSFGDRVVCVRGVDYGGRSVEFSCEDCGFGYRHSAIGASGVVVCEVVFALDDVGSAGAGSLRERLKEVMSYKKSSQPMADASAGCAFKNPTLVAGIDSVGEAGERVSAGKLIDLAGCKGLRNGSAIVSERHGNFITADVKREDGGRGDDVYALMCEVRSRVLDRFGVRLEREVVVWGPGGVVLDDDDCDDGEHVCAAVDARGRDRAARGVT